MDIRQDVIEQQYTWTALGIATQIQHQKETYADPDREPNYIRHGEVFERNSLSEGEYRFIVVLGGNMLFVDYELDTFVVSVDHGMDTLEQYSGRYARHIHDFAFVLEKIK